MKPKQLKIWMIQKNVKAVDVARDCGVTEAYVSMVISGKRVGEVVRRWLVNHGCPAEFLEEGESTDIPEQSEAAA